MDDRCQEFRDRITQLQENAQLVHNENVDRMDKLEKEKNDLQAKIKEILLKKDKLQQQHNDQIKVLKQNIVDDVQKVSEDYEQRIKEIQKLNDENLKNKQELLESMKSEQHNVMTYLNRLKQEFDKNNSSCMDLFNKCGSELRDIKRYTSIDLEKLKLQVDELSSKNDVYKKQMDQLDDKFKLCKVEKNDAIETIAALRNELQDNKTLYLQQITEMSTKLNILERENSVIKESLVFKESICDNSTEIERVKAELLDERAKQADIIASNVILNDRVEQLSMKIAEYELISSKQDICKSDLSNCKSRIDSLTNECREWKDRCKK